MRSRCALTLVLLWATIARAEEVKPVELVLHPQTIESPVLKYRLFPEEAELKEGNAAPILLRLPWEQQVWMQKVAPTLHEWSERPLSDPEWKTAGQILPDSFYREMKRAAFRREAKWEYPIGEQSPFFILLPDAQGLRQFLGHGLATKIRYHLTRGELTEAREGILVGLANARHMAQTPFFVNQLVANAIQRTMIAQIQEVVAQPKSPNLYWALAAIPDSLTEIDRAASFEGSLIAKTFPMALEWDQPHDAAEWQKTARQLVELLIALGEMKEAEKPDTSALAQLLQQLNPAGPVQGTPLPKLARSELAELLHLPVEKVNAMSDEEAAVRWYVNIRVARDQKAAAILRLPSHDAWPQLKQLEKEDAALKEKLGGKVSPTFNPTSVYLSLRSSQRRLEILRAVEAARHHLATHDGKLPMTLNDIQEPTVPLDSLTGKPFEWRLNDGAATLATPPLPDSIAPEMARAHHVEYRLRVASE